MAGTVLIEAGLFALLESPAGPVTRYVTGLADQTADLARQNVQAQFTTRTGTLYNSIGVFPQETDDGVSFEVGTDGAPYGRVLELGQEAHIIEAQRFPVMFSEPGHPDPLINPQRRVSHPGAGPSPWLQPALEQVINGV